MTRLRASNTKRRAGIQEEESTVLFLVSLFIFLEPVSVRGRHEGHSAVGACSRLRRLFPQRTDDVDFLKDVLSLAPVLGGVQLRLEFGELPLAAITAVQFDAA